LRFFTLGKCGKALATFSGIILPRDGKQEPFPMHWAAEHGRLERLFLDVFGFNGFSENFLFPICFRMLSGEFAGILWPFGSTSGGTSLSSFCDTLLEKIC